MLFYSRLVDNIGTLNLSSAMAYVNCEAIKNSTLRPTGRYAVHNHWAPFVAFASVSFSLTTLIFYTFLNWLKILKQAVRWPKWRVIEYYGRHAVDDCYYQLEKFYSVEYFRKMTWYYNVSDHIIQDSAFKMVKTENWEIIWSNESYFQEMNGISNLFIHHLLKYCSHIYVHSWQTQQ